MDLRQMKQQHASHIKWFRNLDAVLEKEKREQTPTEQTEYEKRFSECEGLKERIERGEKHKSLMLEKTVFDEVPKSEKRSYSLTSALQELAGEKRGSYEREIHEELSKTQKSQSERSILVPIKELFGKSTYPQKYEKRVIDGEGSLISDPIREEMTLLGLYENSIMDKLNVTKITADGEFNWPVGDTVTSGWFSASGGSASTDKISEDDLSFSTTSVVPKFLGVASGWSYKQLVQMKSSLSLENLVRRSLSMGMAQELDRALLRGTNANNQPQGIFNWLGTENKTTLGLKSSAPIRKWTWADITKERKNLRTAFKNNALTAQWVCSPLTEEEWANEQRFSGTSGQSLIEAMSMPVVTNHCEDTRVLYGDFSQAIVVSFQAIELSLGQISDDFLRAVSRIRALGAFSFAYWRKEAFRQIEITRSA